MKLLYDRLENRKELQIQLYVIMQNAINEMHNNGIIASLTGELARVVHDPNPEVRVREKTSLAKAIGKKFIPQTLPVPSQGGLSYLINLNYNPSFVNSITLCIQGGIESLHTTFASNPNVKLDKYIIQVIPNGNDLSALKANIEQLDRMYDDISIVLMSDGQMIYSKQASPQTQKAPASVQKRENLKKKKTGFWSKLFEK